MNPVRRFRLTRAVFAGAAILLGLIGPALQGQAPPAVQAPASLDVQDAARALEHFNAGNYADAATLYGGIPTKYPSSPLIPEATFRLGYINYLQGEYEKAVELLEKVGTIPNAPKEIVELATLLVPQVSSAKASKLAAGEPARRDSFEEAVRGFDTFMKSFPQSEEVESANFGKAVALLQLERYEDAAAALRINLQRFPQSASALDSQYLLALTLSALATVTNQKATAVDASAEKNYTEAERLLNDIITKRTDVAIANDARFQIGELNFARAGFTTNDETRRKALLNRALDSYRLVASKDLVIQAQRARIEQFKQLTLQALRARDFPANKRYQRLIEKETEKLALLENREDQTLTAKFKSGEIFFQLGRADEARVVLNFIGKFLDKPEVKTQAAYTRVMSYAIQQINANGANADLAKKLEEQYRAFIAAHPKSKIGDNLAILVGSGFVESDPEKAIKYFKESLTDYPEGRFRIEALAQQAAALAKLQRFDEALKLYQETLATKPAKEIAAAAELGIATIYRETGKKDEAIASFKSIREKYTGTDQAEQAGFYIGQLLMEKGDIAGAITELETFTKTYPKNANAPEALFALAQAQLAGGKKDAALATFKEVPAKFPESRVAPYTYFQRAQVMQTDQKLSEVIVIMREFIKAYPESDELFQAYDYIAQIHAAEGKTPEAVAVYEEFAKDHGKHPNAPTALRKVAGIWKAHAISQGRYMALKDEQRAEWTKGLDNSVTVSERILNEYAGSPEVALALQDLLEVEKLRRQAKLITDADVEKYFQDLAAKFADNPATRSKVIFTLASFTYEQDKDKAIAQMSGVYDPTQKYAPADLDLYGQALIQQGKLDEAMTIYGKLAADYPTPPNTEPAKAARDIQEAQSMALFGSGKVLQEQKKLDEAKQRFDQLEKLYAWSPKMQEANYGIALGLHEQKSYDEALKRLTQVTRSNTAPATLRANGMLLFGRIKEEQGDYQSAIDNYIKIASFYSGVPDAAAEGLWRGAQLLEKQGQGELPMPKLADKKAAGAKK